MLKKLAGLFLIIPLLITGCSDSTPKVEPEATLAADNPWQNILNSHSSGQLSRFDALDFKFNRDLPKELDESFLSITPAIEGQGRLVNQRHYRFVPNDPLPSGQNYKISLNPKPLGLPDTGFEPYDIDVQVIKQAFQLEVSGLKAQKAETMSLSGTVTTADTIQVDEIKDLLSSTYIGSALSILWEEKESSKVHSFSIENIQRGEENNNLILAWDGQVIGVEDKGQRQFDVPAIGSFVVSSIHAAQGNDQKIEINFSEKLDTNQDMKGLIQLSKGSFRTKQEGSKLTVYLKHNISGEVTLTIDSGIQNKEGFLLGKPINKTLKFLSKKPSVRFVGKGAILPTTDQLTIPFESVNVDSVQVTAFKVYQDNMAQFFQENTLNQSRNLKDVGRYIWRKTIQLDSPVQDKWNRYNLDVQDLVAENPGSLFRFELSLNRSNSIYPCSEDDNAIEIVKERPYANYEDNRVVEKSGWDGIQSNYSYSSYNWKDRSNPCKDAYYSSSRDVKNQRNFIGSDIGLLAKAGENDELLVVATRLSTGENLSDTKITILNYQGQTIAESTTDSSGFTNFTLASTPFLVIAKNKDDVGYLKVNKALALSTSHFDVGGSKSENGIKGHIYAERGVWRPGDDIFLTVVIEDKNDAVPDNHPVMLEFFNPKNQRVTVQVNSNPLNGFYTFKLSTSEEDVTGTWKAVASLGGIKFSKPIPVETVKPNHLKMAFTLAQEEVKATKVKKNRSDAQLQGDFYSRWLHGAKASDLKADIKLKMRSQRTKFSTYADYKFDDPVRVYSGRQQNLAEFKLDAEGAAKINVPFSISSMAPGKLKGTLTSRVFEPSGDFSVAKQSIDIHPYQRYVGLSMPKGDAARGMLLTDETHKVDLVVVDTQGKPKLGSQTLDVSLFKLSWKWWWDSSSDNLANYTSRYSRKPIKEETINIQDGQGQWDFEVKHPEWGRYLVRVCDKDGYHCTGQIFYMDWPGWAGRGQKKKGLGANMLTLSSDKTQYNVGETAVVSLPQANTGRALVSIENGSKVLKYFWVDLEKDGTQINVPIEQSMAPNVYVSVSVIQPHIDRQNDEAIRLMGILPITVKDEATHLTPVLKTPAEVQPETTLSIDVSEKSGKAMTYTIAIVDEGLLGLTQYKTPNLHKQFYKKEALGVRTWDLFDHVVGAYGGNLEKLLAIGGDGSGNDKDEESEDRRFPPVVKFIGPFHLEAGETKKHDVAIPQYLGAVRVMLVSGQDAAYGHTESEVLVRKPLSVLATLPRVLGQDETLQMPVNLFATQDDIKGVEIEVTATENIEVLNPVQNTEFDGSKEKMVFVPLRAKEAGQGKVTILAKSGGYSAKQVINIPVQYQVAEQKKVVLNTIEANKNTEIDVPVFGIANTRQSAIEITAMPPMNLRSHLDYLVRYPHGCVEQTTSKALPQLLLPELVNLNEEELRETQDNVSAAIHKLQRYQTAYGGFSYWPGAGNYHDWATTYAGLLLILAKERGYEVPQAMFDAWLVHQKQGARAWTTGTIKVQAYRLYTLALSNNAEMGAMNRLRQQTDLDNVSKLLLAAAYKLAGQLAAAEDLAANLDMAIAKYEVADHTFGSQLRDEAIALMSLMVLGEDEQSKLLVDKISQSIRDQKKRYSTQTTAFALLAMSQYGKSIPESLSKVTVNWQGEDLEFELKNIINQFDIASAQADGDGNTRLTIQSSSNVPLFVTTTTSAIPEKGQEVAVENELAMSIRYYNDQNKEISLNSVDQGMDVRAQVTISNKSLHDLSYLSLEYPVASGFEIRNTAEEAETNANMDYQDVRDDRIFTYFKLKKGEVKSFEYRFNASYQGRYYQPSILVQDMYEEDRQARNLGYWVEVLRK